MAGPWRAQLPAEVVAVITAALAAAMDQPVGSFTIRSIEPATPGWGRGPGSAGPAGPLSGSGWAKAGVVQAHLTRAQFGGRTR